MVKHVIKPKHFTRLSFAARTFLFNCTYVISVIPLTQGFPTTLPVSDKEINNLLGFSFCLKLY